MTIRIEWWNENEKTEGTTPYKNFRHKKWIIILQGYIVRVSNFCVISDINNDAMLIEPK